MNILEAKKAYDDDKKIRHRNWDKNYWCDKNHNACLGDNLLFFNGLSEWLNKYQDGWEIYLITKQFRDLTIGQTFKYGDVTYEKVDPQCSDVYWNVIRVDDRHICHFQDETLVEPVNTVK